MNKLGMGLIIVLLLSIVLISGCTSSEEIPVNQSHEKEVTSALVLYDNNRDNKIELMDEDGDGYSEFASWVSFAGLDSATALNIFDKYDGNMDGYWNATEMNNFFEGNDSEQLKQAAIPEFAK